MNQKTRLKKCEKEGKISTNQERDCSNAYNTVYQSDFKYLGEKLDKTFKDIFK